ncbi:hypothetical protein KPSA3_03956 [Pseudomonas syringae pv. actinidiae]|uniref:Uncharacterized protein n=1 Tax=Pseudomonas syringae pv. actinidiae TaxID=103796 RepID=A0AAN4Q5N7_PSESF|nr:hypothetical protein KPSA3_03956 [Pseudomonas syringae pv. actinidiae]
MIPRAIGTQMQLPLEPDSIQRYETSAFANLAVLVYSAQS